MRFRIKYADRIVGLFVIIAGMALLGTIIMAGANQRWFTKDFRYETVLGSAAAAAPGTGIFMRGFQVGKIEKVELDAKNQVRARFVIYNTYRSQVLANSLIEIVTSPIGLGTQILFHPGKGPDLVDEGSLIPEVTSVEGQAIIEAELVELPKKDDTITRLLAGINPLIENVGKTVVSLNKTLSEVNKALVGEGSTPIARIVTGAADTMTGVNRLVANVDKTVSDVDKTVNDVDKTVGTADRAVGDITASLQGLMGDLSTVTANLATLSAGLSDPTGLVPKLLDPKGSLKTLLDDNNAIYNSLNGSIADVQRAVSGLADVTGSLGAEVPGIAATIMEINTTVKQAQDVLEGLKNNPLLRGGIPQRTEQPAVFQSLREGLF